MALNFYIIGAHASWHARDLGRAVADVRVNRDWIDKSVGPGAVVASIWFPAAYPNIRPDAAGLFGGWLLFCNALALIGAATLRER